MFTARLQPTIEGEAKQFAASLGISLNALLSVALRDYLDARATPKLGVPSGSSPALMPPPAASSVEPSTMPALGVTPKRGPKPPPRQKPRGGVRGLPDPRG